MFMKRLALIERSLHKVYENTYKVLKDCFEVDIISSDINADTRLDESSDKSSTPFIWYGGLLKHLKQSNPDIVAVRTYYRLYSLVALFYSIFYRKPFYVFEERQKDCDSFFFNLLEKIALLFLKPIFNWKVKKFICVTKPCLKYMGEQGFENLVFIPTPYKRKVKKPRKGKKLKILCIARFVKFKQHELLIKAVNYLVEKRMFKKNEIVVTFIGNGPLEQRLKTLCSRYGLKSVFVFKGRVSNDKIDAACRGHNLFVLPSSYEPVGMVVFEAMSNALPCVVSDTCGALNESTLEFRTGDFRSLARAINIFRNSQLRFEWGLYSSCWLDVFYHPNKIKKRLRRIIK